MIEDENVHRLTDINGREVVLIGTAHVSKESADLVKRVIEDEKPDVVCVELCDGRLQSVQGEKSWKDMDIIQVIKEGRALLLTINFILSSWQRKMAKQLGVRPGEEMLVAIATAEECDAQLDVIDRDVRITLSRTWGLMGFWKKLGLFANAFGSVFDKAEDPIDEQEIEELKKQDSLEVLLNEMGDNLPDVKKRLIDERDLYMVENIRLAPEGKVVAIVGAGHVPGMLKNWENKEISLEALEEKPPKSPWGTLLKWGIPAIIIGMFIFGFVYGGDDALEKLKNAGLVWVLANGCLSAFGALLAGAHILTIITAFIAAPITSLNPTIGAGMVTGFVETYLRKPKVADFDELHDDLETFAGWRRNRVTRILMVFFASSMGSALGTYLGGWLVAQSFFGS